MPKHGKKTVRFYRLLVTLFPDAFGPSTGALGSTCYAQVGVVAKCMLRALQIVSVLMDGQDARREHQCTIGCAHVRFEQLSWLVPVQTVLLRFPAIHTAQISHW
jgi:hypothetical protein